jgi:hypothetical protein
MTFWCVLGGAFGALFLRNLLSKCFNIKFIIARDPDNIQNIKNGRDKHFKWTLFDEPSGALEINFIPKDSQLSV